jgi:hypothetical protein
MRRAKHLERSARKTGKWGKWEYTHFSTGTAGKAGWVREIVSAARNDAYVVLLRPLKSGVHHLAIRTASNAEPPWRDLQRIKDELGYKGRFAFQVCPPHERIIDQADMYHLWVMPEGYEPGFGLHPLDEATAPRESEAAS